MIEKILIMKSDNYTHQKQNSDSKVCLRDFPDKRSDGAKAIPSSVYETVDKNGQISETQNKQPTQKTDKRTNKLSNDRTSGQTTLHLSARLSGHLFEQAGEQTSGQANGQLNNCKSGQVSGKSSNWDVGNFSETKPPPGLNQNQYLILKYIYFNRPFKVYGRNGLEQILNIKYGTIRHCLRSLERKGFIEKPFQVNDGFYNGTNCRVYSEVCYSLFGSTQIPQPERPRSKLNVSPKTGQQLGWENGQASGQVHGQVDKQTTDSNSSSSFFKKTTYCACSSKIDVDWTDPELVYWAEQELLGSRVAEWVKEFRMPADMIILQLKWANFDLIYNGKEKIIKENAQDWFWGALKKGGYRKPKNYKSHSQMQMEHLREEKKALESERKELKAAIAEYEKALTENEFLRVMADPSGDLYRQCLEAMPHVHKDRYRDRRKRCGGIFEKEMRRAFVKVSTAN